MDYLSHRQVLQRKNARCRLSAPEISYLTTERKLDANGEFVSDTLVKTEKVGKQYENFKVSDFSIEVQMLSGSISQLKTCRLSTVSDSSLENVEKALDTITAISDLHENSKTE